MEISIVYYTYLRSQHVMMYANYSFSLLAYSTLNEGQRETGVNLFTLTSLTTKQNVYYQRL